MIMTKVDYLHFFFFRNASAGVLHEDNVVIISALFDN